MLIDGEELVIRDVSEDDYAFIFSTWLKSYRDLSRGNGVNKDVFWKEHHKVVEKLMPLVRVACTPRSVITIHGWVCGEPGILHYAYVTPDLVTTGLAREMVKFACGDGDLTITHAKVQACPVSRYVYNPYLIGVVG